MSESISALRREVRITLETITPLFLAGADPRGKPELRPPAFRGAMRYWWRAAMGGVIGDNKDELQKLESQVFGNTDHGSPIAVRISNPSFNTKIFEKSKNGITTGRDYLYWSMSKTNRENAKSYIENGKFDLILTKNLMEEIHFDQAVASLWLSLHLGGIGSRSRRTAGSIAATLNENYKTLLFQNNSKNSAEMMGWLTQNIRATRKFFGESAVNVSQSFYDILHKDFCQIWVLGQWKTADEAIEEIGASLRDFRYKRQPDTNNVAKWLNEESISTVDRSIFGLPIPWRYPNLDLSGAIQAKDRNDRIDRRSSPLWLKITKTDTNCYFGIATLFKSEFLPNTAKLSLGKKGSNVLANPPKDFSLIQKFIAEKFTNARQVTL